MKNSLLFIQSLLALLCCWWLWESIDWNEVFSHCTAISLGALSIVFLQRFMPWVLLGCRLSAIFSQQITQREGFIASALCVGTNAILPARVGEIIKIFWLKGYKHFSYATVISRCFIERLLDVSILVFLSICFALNYAQPLLIFAMVLVLCFTWLGCFLLIQYPKKIQKILPFLCRPMWCEILDAVQTSLTYATSFKVLFKLTLWTLGIWILNYIHIALICNWLVQLSLNWQQIGALTVCVFFSSAFLLIPGGIGVMEVAIVIILQMMHIDAQHAAMVAVFVRLFHLLPSVLVGVLALFQESPQKNALRQFLQQNKNNRLSLLYKTVIR